MIELNKIYFEDCIETLRKIEDATIHFMLQDLPYNTTHCDFEYNIVPLLPELWKEWNRVAKPNCAFIFTALEPFRTDLILSNRKNFRYDLVWEKNIAGNFHHANKMPQKVHEHILVFYRSQPTYNIQYYKDKPYRKKVSDNRENVGRTVIVNNRIGYDSPEGLRMQKSVYFIPADKERFITKNKQNTHPTQKPLNLFRTLIRTYSNENEIVFDGFMGSGTTALAAIKEKRNFIGSEINDKYYKLSIDRIESILQQHTLL